MKFQEIQPISPLRPYIDRIFILECEGKLPADDLKLIVPNARIKLVIPYKNSINLGSIIRFQHFYQSVHANKERYFFERELYDYYYDQAHFIKDIKRFTGYPPKQLLQQNNDYDRFFYKG